MRGDRVGLCSVTGREGTEGREVGVGERGWRGWRKMERVIKNREVGTKRS